MLPLDSSNFSKFYKSLNSSLAMTENEPMRMNKSATAFDEYIGNYVLIGSEGGVYLGSGKASKIEDGFLVLNPFLGSRDGQKNIFSENKKIKLSAIATIEPRSLSELEKDCVIINNKERKQIPD